MALTPEQNKVLIEHVNKKWKGSQCRQCEANNWSVDGIIQIALGEFPGPVQLGGTVLPTVAVICRNCGNTVLINLVIAGVVEGVAK
jgi:hypothetical protein